jgi:transketolase
MTAIKSNLETFAETLLEAAQRDPQIMVVASDSRGSGRLAPFFNAFPRRAVEVGIAEQNLVGVAAGLAAMGKKVFAVSPACFLTARSFEQIKNDVAYSNQPVRLVGISAGVSYGALGSTHHALHDLAALQAVPNLDIVVPADAFETRAAVQAAVNHPRPLYLRFGRRSVEKVHPCEPDFSIGKAIFLREGSDLTFLAIGETVTHALGAAEILAGHGISCTVASLHTLRPLDETAIISWARTSRAVVTVEEHSIYGGLGSRCALLLMEAGISVRFRCVGIPDEPAVAGSQQEVFQHYSISPEGLAKTARDLLG